MSVYPRKLDELPRFRAALEPLGFMSHSVDPDAPRRLVDAFGLVEEGLRRHRVAVVGGSFGPHGGHNLWEPLAAGCVTVIGPRHEAQETLVAALRAEGLLEISARPDLDALAARPDPGEALAAFAARERTRLDAAVAALGRRLGRNPA